MLDLPSFNCVVHCKIVTNNYEIDIFNLVYTPNTVIFSLEYYVLVEEDQEIYYISLDCNFLQDRMTCYSSKIIMDEALQSDRLDGKLEF